MADEYTVSGRAVVTNVRRSWDWDPAGAGRRAVLKYGRALALLAEHDAHQTGDPRA